MQIEIKVGDVDLTSVIGDTYDDDHDRRMPQTLGQAVAEQITRNLMQTDAWNGMAALVKRIREEEIRAAVQREIADALTNPVQTTNTYGEPTGKTTTLRTLIAEMAKETLNRPADRYGSGEGGVRKVLRDEVDRALVAELSAVVKDEKAKVVAVIRGKAADLIATAVREGLGR